jgi:GT2 family glycosyltransferase
MIRRDALEKIGGWDEGFFLYCEDKDLCKRLRDAGYDIRYEPSAVSTHQGGGSAPRASLASVLAASRIRYAKKHRSRPAAFLERIGIGLTASTHVVVTRGGWAARAGHAASLAVAAGLRPGQRRASRTADGRGG